MIKKHHIIASIILLFCTEIHAQSWTLLWEDEFNSTTLDSNYWSHDIGSGTNLTYTAGVIVNFNIINHKILVFLMEY